MLFKFEIDAIVWELGSGTISYPKTQDSDLEVWYTNSWTIIKSEDNIIHCMIYYVICPSILFYAPSIDCIVL